MAQPPKTELSEQELERLLLRLGRRPDQAVVTEFQQLALVLVGEATAEEVVAAAETLRTSPMTAQVLLTLADCEARNQLGVPVRDQALRSFPEEESDSKPQCGLKSTGPTSSRPDFRGAGSTSAGRGRRRWAGRWPMLAGLAAAVLLVVGGILFWPLPEQTEHAGPLVPKGADDHLLVWAVRGAQRFEVDSGTALQAGDHLGFAYAAARAGYLMVLLLDDEGQVTIIHPTGPERDCPIRPGERVLLPAGAVMEQGRECEWFVGVFSDQPLDPDLLIMQLITTPRSDQNCMLDLQGRLEGARMIQVLPVRRGKT